MRYGLDNLDYLFIMNTSAIMIMHPLVPKLNGSDQTELKDRSGKRWNLEIVSKAKEFGHGYVEYDWQYKDNKDRIEKKISFSSRGNG